MSSGEKTKQKTHNNPKWGKQSYSFGFLLLGETLLLSISTCKSKLKKKEKEFCIFKITTNLRLRP